MLERVTAHWWVLLLRGILSIAVGVIAIAVPGVTAIALALLFAAYALISGIASIVAAIRTSHAEGTHWVWLLAGGIISVLFGATALIVPGIALLYLVFLIAAWAVITGVTEIMTAWRLRDAITGEWLWIIAGAFSIIFGIIVALEPAAGIFVVVYIFAFYAMLAGVTFVGLSLRLRARHARSAAP